MEDRVAGRSRLYKSLKDRLVGGDVPVKIQGLDATFLGFDESHVIDALAYGQAQARVTRPSHKPLTDYSDAELVMEMIRRGYAAMKLPADGGPPKVLT